MARRGTEVGACNGSAVSCCRFPFVLRAVLRFGKLGIQISEFLIREPRNQAKLQDRNLSPKVTRP
jgi:hypothetical protein